MDNSLTISHFINFVGFFFKHLSHARTVFLYFGIFFCKTPISESKFFKFLVSSLNSLIKFSNALAASVLIFEPAGFILLLRSTNLCEGLLYQFQLILGKHVLQLSIFKFLPSLGHLSCQGVVIGRLAFQLELQIGDVLFSGEITDCMISFELSQV